MNFREYLAENVSIDWKLIERNLNDIGDLILSKIDDKFKFAKEVDSNINASIPQASYASLLVSSKISQNKYSVSFSNNNYTLNISEAEIVKGADAIVNGTKYSMGNYGKVKKRSYNKAYNNKEDVVKKINNWFKDK